MVWDTLSEDSGMRKVAEFHTDGVFMQGRNMVWMVGTAREEQGKQRFGLLL
jgi:hypothetical protein